MLTPITLSRCKPLDHRRILLHLPGAARPAPSGGQFLAAPHAPAGPRLAPANDLSRS
jgi:hypothetical protein